MSKQNSRPQSSIEKEYATTLIKLISSTDTETISDYSYHLRQLNAKLASQNLRATIKIGTQKIE